MIDKGVNGTLVSVSKKSAKTLLVSISVEYRLMIRQSVTGAIIEDVTNYSKDVHLCKIVHLPIKYVNQHTMVPGVLMRYNITNRIAMRSKILRLVEVSMKVIKPLLVYGIRILENVMPFTKAPLAQNLILVLTVKKCGAVIFLITLANNRIAFKVMKLTVHKVSE